MKEVKKKSTERCILQSISFSEAKTMVNNYVSQIKRDANGQHEQTISVWFEIGHIRAILELLEQELKDSVATNPDKVTDGLRIYFANYGNNPPKDNPEYVNKNTVVLVSTHSVKGEPNKHKDYFDHGVPLIADPIRKKAHSALMTLLVTPPENRGTLCPPDKGCDCDSIIFDPANLPFCEIP